MGRVFADFYDPDCELYFPFWAYGAEQEVIRDISGNRNDGTINGPHPSIGEMGTYRCIGWYFDGDDNVNHGELLLGKTHTLHYFVQHNNAEDAEYIHHALDVATNYFVQLTDTTIGYGNDGAMGTAAVAHGGFTTTSLPTLLSVVRGGNAHIYFYQNGLYLGTDDVDSDDNMILEQIGPDFTGNVFDVYVSLSAWDQRAIQNFYEQTRRKYGNL